MPTSKSGSSDSVGLAAEIVSTDIVHNSVPWADRPALEQMRTFSGRTPHVSLVRMTRRDRAERRFRGDRQSGRHVLLGGLFHFRVGALGGLGAGAAHRHDLRLFER